MQQLLRLTVDPHLCVYNCTSDSSAGHITCSIQQVALCQHGFTFMLHCCMALPVTSYVTACSVQHVASLQHRLTVRLLYGHVGHTTFESMQSAAYYIVTACFSSAGHITCSIQQVALCQHGFTFDAALLQGSVDHTTCEYQRLIDAEPDTIIPARPFTVHDRVYDAGDPLGGNFCPYNSSTPLQPCKKVPQALLNCFQKSNTSSFINIVFILLLPCRALSPHQTLLQ